MASIMQVGSGARAAVAAFEGGISSLDTAAGLVRGREAASGETARDLAKALKAASSQTNEGVVALMGSRGKAVKATAAELLDTSQRLSFQSGVFAHTAMNGHVTTIGHGDAVIASARARLEAAVRQLR